jgi:hypothetical protein
VKITNTQPSHTTFLVVIGTLINPSTTADTGNVVIKAFDELGFVMSEGTFPNAYKSNPSVLTGAAVTRAANVIFQPTTL